MTPVASARILSLAMLLLSCAPLASLYAVTASSFAWCNLLDVPNQMMADDVDVGRKQYQVQAKPSTTTATTTATTATTPTTNKMKPEKKKSSSNSSKKTRNDNSKHMALDELWRSLFRPTKSSPTHTIDSYILDSLARFPAQHWSIILPWGISLLLGVIVPCVLSIASYSHGRQLDDVYYDEQEDEAEDYMRYQRQEKRLKRLIVAVQDHRKILDETDVDPTDVDHEGVPRWSLPSPGPAPATDKRKVEGVCAICLGVYACDDHVVWSSNPECPHAFHEHCILSWLVRRRKQCPCCRQSFLPKGQSAATIAATTATTMAMTGIY